MGEAPSSQPTPSGVQPEAAVRYRRKCFDGYYRMFTMGEWADHLTEHEEEYELTRQAIAEKGDLLYPDLTEEEDRARFTVEELAMSEEDRIRSHATRKWDEREALKKAEEEAWEAAHMAEITEEMNTMMRASRRMATEVLQAEVDQARAALEEEERLRAERTTILNRFRASELNAATLARESTDFSVRAAQLTSLGDHAQFLLDFGDQVRALRRAAEEVADLRQDPVVQRYLNETQERRDTSAANVQTWMETLTRMEAIATDLGRQQMRE